MKHVSELKECPFCGHDENIIKQRATAIVEYGTRFDGEEADNTGLHDGMEYKDISKFAFCRNCYKKIAKL